MQTFEFSVRNVSRANDEISRIGFSAAHIFLLLLIFARIVTHMLSLTHPPIHPPVPTRAQTKEEIDTKAFERQRRINNPFSLEGAVMSVNPMWQKATAAQAAAHIPQTIEHDRADAATMLVNPMFGAAGGVPITGRLRHVQSDKAVILMAPTAIHVDREETIHNYGSSIRNIFAPCLSKTTVSQRDPLSDTSCLLFSLAYVHPNHPNHPIHPTVRAPPSQRRYGRH